MCLAIVIKSNACCHALRYFYHISTGYNCIRALFGCDFCVPSRSAREVPHEDGQEEDDEINSALVAPPLSTDSSLSTFLHDDQNNLRPTPTFLCSTCTPTYYYYTPPSMCPRRHSLPAAPAAHDSSLTLLLVDDGEQPLWPASVVRVDLCPPPTEWRAFHASIVMHAPASWLIAGVDVVLVLHAQPVVFVRSVAEWEASCAPPHSSW